MTKYCSTCKTNKSDIDFSPTSRYCRTCVSARKARSDAIKKGTLQRLPQGRPKKSVSRNTVDVIGQQAQLTTRQVFIRDSCEALQNLRSENIDELLIESLVLIARLATHIQKGDTDGHVEQQAVTQDDIQMTKEKLDTYICDNEYYTCYNTEKKVWCECSGKSLKPYLLSITTKEYSQWTVQDMDATLADELMQRRYTILFINSSKTNTTQCAE